MISGHQEFFFLAIWWAGYFFPFFPLSSLLHLCCMQFFSSDKRLQEFFFQNHPPPPQELNGRPLIRFLQGHRKLKLPPCAEFQSRMNLVMLQEVYFVTDIPW